VRFEVKIRRTESNPLAGVVFTADELEQIGDLAAVLAKLPPDMLTALRWSLARDLVELENLSFWTEGETEEFRVGRELRSALLYEATFPAQTT
jgi:hypothetical protein